MIPVAPEPVEPPCACRHVDVPGRWSPLYFWCDEHTPDPGETMFRLVQVEFSKPTITLKCAVFHSDGHQCTWVNGKWEH